MLCPYVFGMNTRDYRFIYLFENYKVFNQTKFYVCFLKPFLLLCKINDKILKQIYFFVITCIVDNIIVITRTTMVGNMNQLVFVTNRFFIAIITNIRYGAHRHRDRQARWAPAGSKKYRVGIAVQNSM